MTLFNKIKVVLIIVFSLQAVAFFIDTPTFEVKAACTDSMYPDCRSQGSCSGSEECTKVEPDQCKCVDQAPDPTPVPTAPPPTPVPPIVISPFPEPPVPCNQIRTPEFHSLRPYQASPCNPNVEDVALMCGNDLFLTDPFSIHKIFGTDFISFIYTLFPDGQPIYPTKPTRPGFANACTYCAQNNVCVRRPPPCIPDPEVNCGSNADCEAQCINNGDGTEYCAFNITRVRDLAVDLEGAYLPIMGNTELVINSQNQDPEDPTKGRLDDPLKVNEYVSWYLNGVIGRAEYNPPNMNTEEGERKVIDFSGPLKRLLPFESQEDIREDEIRDARRSVNPLVLAKIRHNQIAGCVFLPSARIRCYPPIFYYITPIRLTFLENIGLRFITKLFTYVPFSSTEDRRGLFEIVSYEIQPSTFEDFVIVYSEITDQVPADLFFAHMQESYELADIFQQIFSPEEADLDAEPYAAAIPTDLYCDLREVRSNPGDNLFAGELTATVTYTAQVYCTFAIRDPNIPGNLCRRLSGGEADCYTGYDYCDPDYGQVDCPSGYTCGANCGNFPSGVTCSAFYHTRCFPSSWSCSDEYTFPSGLCPSGFKCASGCTRETEVINLVQTCDREVYVSFATQTKTPLAREVWAKLVAGPAGVFRRIFPQIEDVEGRPIRNLWAIPAATSVIFRATGVSVSPGPPGSGRTNPEIYFPYIGGIHEYFLKCTQSLIRPWGFGAPCKSGEPPKDIPPLECPFEKIPPLPTNGSCTLPYSQIGDASVPPLMKKIFEAAGAQYGVPPALIAGIMYAEGGFENRVINTSCYGEVGGEYTEETIENAVLCEFKNCNPERFHPPCNFDSGQGDFCIGTADGAFGPYQQCPHGYNPCNFYEATMRMAEKLAQYRYGIPNYSISGDKSTSCVGYKYNTGSIKGSKSCTKSAWPCEDVVTAMRFHTGLCIPDHFCNMLAIYGSCSGACN